MAPPPMPQQQPHTHAHAHVQPWEPHAALRQSLLPGALPPPIEAAGTSRGHAEIGEAAPAVAAASAAPTLQPAHASTPTYLPPRPDPQPFDPSTIGRWIFPTNVQERQYQFEISSVAVRHNTLVSLPTGLGKTLIASVVMYNFSRWFPTGKCLFVAPTKPLVHQQVSAVRRAIGLPLADFAELTGQMKAEARAQAWREKRLFFLTPQTLINDMCVHATSQRMGLS